MLKTGILIALVAAVLAATLSVQSSANATPFGVTVTVRVTIDAVKAIDCFDSTVGVGCGDADFYAIVGIDGIETPSPRIDDENTADPNPDWVIERPVHANDGPIPVFIEIRDDDSGLRATDDHADIDPTNGGDTFNLDLSVQVDPVCSVTGDATIATQACGTFQASTGTADNNKASIRYKVEVIAPDGDGDWLPDYWETGGLNSDGNAGNGIEVDLASMGADPGRKDLFLEIDCLRVTGGHSHCPSLGAIQDVVQAFADAPVNNVDGSTGIQLHIDVGNLFGDAPGSDTKVRRTGAAVGGVTGSFGNYGGGGDRIDETGNTIVDWDGATGSPATNFYTLKGQNFNSNRALAFRYALFAHQVNARAASNDCTSGWSEGGVDTTHTANLPGNDFIISLGGTNPPPPPPPGGPGGPATACWGTDAAGNSVGSRSQQAGTLMHEFGHTLSLDHGGNQEANNKPNYLSVMNYAISTGPAATPNNVQMCNVPALGGLPGGCDYSRIALPALNETLPPGLDECAGIGLGLGGTDWDGANGITGASCNPVTANVSANINNDFADPDHDHNRDSGEDTPLLSNLTGSEDWNSIRYDFRANGSFNDGSVPSNAAEPTPQMIADARAFLAQLLQPTLSVDKTGPSDANPGDTLSYSIKVNSTGSGPALATVITDTKPDASQVTFDLGTATVGSEFTRAASYAVPCTTADGTVLTNTADVAGTDLISNPVSASDSVDTTVHAPVLTLSKTATASVNAGEAITYRLTYANTGSAQAKSVVVTDVVPAGVYYSTALDSGGGPRPTTVTLNSNGTRTLTWTIGDLAASSGSQTIEYTARPTLLALGGTSYTNNASVSFTNANGCTYAAVTASASTTVSVVTPTRNPLTIGFWRNHPEQWTAEVRARIQATDQRFDGADGSTPDGALSPSEVAAVYASGGNFPALLRQQLLAVYLNLATRRINAGTGISSKAAVKIGVTNVRGAALYAMNTLLLPVNTLTATRYSNVNTVLDEINNNKSEVY